MLSELPDLGGCGFVVAGGVECTCEFACEGGEGPAYAFVEGFHVREVGLYGCLHAPELFGTVSGCFGQQEAV